MSDVFPRRFGRYVLLEPLAQGGMGALYLAYQGEPGMEKLCVVKTVLRELADKEYVARFRDEAKVVVRLSHGNLVPVFDAGSVDGELYIAMEHVDGRDLRAVWNQCAKKGIAFPLDVAVYLIKELARGLYHAHTAGDLQLVHRDVSPPNVLLAYSGEVKLTDFGLASSTLKLERTAPGVIYGKVSYMAPEQARGEPLDGRADLYAAGVILWELLTGRQLFPNSDGDALERVRNPQVARPSTRASRVPPELDALVMKALAPERDNRYSSGEELRAALAGWLAPEAPTIDNTRVAAFLRELFDDEIERERRRRERLVEDARRQLALPESARTTALSPPPAMDATPELFEGDERSAGVVGQLIDGRYKVNRLVGEGGMGRVYEAEHVEIGKRVAIKVLHPAYSRFPEVVARFRREARAASRIGHPNIVDVTDSGTTASGAVYFVMEYLEGCDLAEVIERERALGVDRAVTIAVQLARALQAAHQASVIHRDLKPENVFLVARPGQLDFVKVLDFGIARQIEMEMASPRLTKPNMAMGTPEYMAPEQAAGRPADARADVYAVGAILYEMLTGHSPHPGDNAMEVLSKKATETPEPVEKLRPDVPSALSRVIMSMLARDPAQRPQTMRELAEELEKARPDRRRRRSESSVAAASRSTSTPERATPPAAAAAPRGNPRIVQLVGAASLLVAGAAAAVVWRSATTPAAAPPAAAPPVVVTQPAAPPVEHPAPRAVEHDPPAALPLEKVALVRPIALSPTPPAAPPPPVTLRSGDKAAREPRQTRKPPPAGPTPAQRKALADGERLLKQHLFDEASREFQKCVGVRELSSRAHTGLAKVAFELSRFDEAVKQGRLAVVGGGGPEAHLVLGKALLKKKNAAAARKEFDSVLRADPSNPEAKRLAAATRG